LLLLINRVFKIQSKGAGRFYFIPNQVALESKPVGETGSGSTADLARGA
jgi:hypothetical protein